RDLVAADAKVQGELVDLPALALREPTALGRLARERGEHTCGRRRVRSLDAEGAVDYGALVCRCVHQVFSPFCGACPVGCPSSASMSPRRSSRRSHSERRSAIQSAAILSPIGSMWQVRTRPTLRVRTIPLRSSTWRC